jgi:hypothetical protein
MLKVKRVVFYAMILTTLVLGTLALIERSSHAGMKSVYFAAVNTSSRYAFGQLGGSRGSPDSTQYLRCTLASTPGAPSVTCSAQNSAGTYGACTSSDAGIREAAQALTQSAYVYFTWDPAGNCTYLYVMTGSDNYPLQP